MPRQYLPSVVALSALLAMSTATVEAAGEEADEALARAAKDYRSRTEFAERLEYTVYFPDGREESKAMEYGRSGDRTFLALHDASGRRLFHIAAGDGLLRATQFNVGAAYLETALDATFGQTLTAIGGNQIGISPPPALAALETDPGAFLESFGFGVLRGVKASAVEIDGEQLVVALEAPGGVGRARLDAATGKLAGVELAVGEGASTVRLAGDIVAIAAPGDDPSWRIDVLARQAVPTFAELEASAYPLGQEAPTLEIRALSGESVALGDLRGKVVILDFWATWCVPCWSALEHLEKVADWARRSGLPIEVWAVDTMERASTFEEQASLAEAFLSERGIDVPVLVDFDDGFFQGLHTPGLPSTVIIAPDGTLARYHSGVSDEMAQILEREARELAPER